MFKMKWINLISVLAPERGRGVAHKLEIAIWQIYISARYHDSILPRFKGHIINKNTF